MTLYTNPKYMEWKSAEEMHEDSRQWCSELEFMDTEARFLDELLSTYLKKMTSGKAEDQAKKLAEKLLDTRKKISFHVDQVLKHQNELSVLVDGIDQPYEEREVKADHKKIQKKGEVLSGDFRGLKKEIFLVAGNIMKEANRNVLIGGKYKK